MWGVGRGRAAAGVAGSSLTALPDLRLSSWRVTPSRGAEWEGGGVTPPWTAAAMQA